MAAPALLCRVRSQLCALPLGNVAETMRPLPVAALAGVPSFVLGVAVIRGSATPVVDAGVLLGLPEPPAPKRFVTLKTGETFVAVAVESVGGIRHIAPEMLQRLPPLLGATTEHIEAIGMLDREFLLVIQAARMVPESVSKAIEGQTS